MSVTTSTAVRIFDSEVNPRHLFALVTQTLRGEVAVVDLSAGKVVDLDSSTPGFRFIPVGKNPIDIVSTPGGVASFVGVADVGKEGIFAIPTRCARPRPRSRGVAGLCAALGPRRDGHRHRPACAGQRR